MVPVEERPAIDAGLSAAQAAARLAADGPNELPEPDEPTLSRRALGHLVEPLSLLLLGAAATSGLVLGHHVEAAAILAIVALNTTLATAQEHRAAASVQALRSLTAPRARVLRDGASRTVAASELVVGDVLVLEAGDRVAADAVLVQASAVAVDEALLSGESFPVEKAPADPLLAGTAVVRGSGSAVVVATGARTAMATMAHLIETRTEAPIVADLRHLAGRLSVVAVLLGVVLVPVVAWRVQDQPRPVATAILAGVALAVAAVPEGLATVVIASMAIGARRLASGGAIVRRVASVETLGSTEVLCTDKTGTLTTGHVVISTVVPAAGEEDLWLALARCDESHEGSGDPLENAIRAGMPAGMTRDTGPRIALRPFDAATRSMATVVDDGGERRLSVKGAPEAVLARCRPGPARARLEGAASQLAAAGERVLAVATGATGDLDADDLTPLGIVTFRDPLRASAPDAVASCLAAGVRLVMVTGDHPATAASIAAAAGIEGPCITGDQLVALDPDARADALRSAAVVARVSPQLKVDLVDAHRAVGRVVAMTGDGVNDAPALRRADVGVAVAGDGGTDVAREAAQLVVTNGDLSTITAAISEGRRIRAGLRAVVAYLVTGNLSEILVVAGALVAFPRLAVPLLPVHLLWCNLVTDGVPALALGVDRRRPPGPDDPPRAVGRALLGRPELRQALARAVVLAVVVLATGGFATGAGWTPAAVRTQILLSLLVAHLVLAYAVRAQRWTFERGWAANRWMLAAVGGSLAAQVGAFTTAAGRSVLQLAPLPPTGWVLAGAAAAAGVLGVEATRPHGRRPVRSGTRRPAGGPRRSDPGGA